MQDKRAMNGEEDKFHVCPVRPEVLGPGSERFPQPAQEEIEEGIEIFTIRFVEAKDGRPA
jgi:hypothetical protein